MKRALIIRHVPCEGVAGYRQPIEEAGYAIDRIDVSDPGFSSVDLREPDLLIMMGGPMGVYEQDRHPWIKCQLKRLAQRLEADRPTLGVCLGSQMMAAALGGHVYAGPVKEVGFHPVAMNDQGLDGPLRHLVDLPVLHWHGDSFTLPDGVYLLASSPHYAHQGFLRGKPQLALQFHVVSRGPRDVAGAARAGAGLLDRLVHGVEHDRMLPHAQVVVRAPDGDFALVVGTVAVDGAWKVAGDAFEISKDPVTALLAQRVDGVFENAAVVHVVCPAPEQPADAGPMAQAIPKPRAAALT